MNHTAANLAKEYYLGGYNCAEAVWLGLTEGLSLEERKQGLKLASGFGGGMGSGHLCGAAAGAVMAIGQWFGRELGGPRKDEAKILAKDLINAIEREFGATNCSILKPNTENYRERCAEYVAFCASTAEALMDRGIVDEGCG